jgi:hypothetical protein
MDANKKGNSMYSYSISFGGTTKQCCHQAWDFCYGVCPATRKRASARRKNRTSVPFAKKVAKSLSKQHSLATWLKHFAKAYGDQLPFGDYQHSTEIRLPYGKKSMVYEIYRDEVLKDQRVSQIHYH